MPSAARSNSWSCAGTVSGKLGQSGLPRVKVKVIFPFASPMASRALTARFISTCVNCERSPRTAIRLPLPGLTSSSTSAGKVERSSCSVSRITSVRGTTLLERSPARPKARI